GAAGAGKGGGLAGVGGGSGRLRESETGMGDVVRCLTPFGSQTPGGLGRGRGGVVSDSQRVSDTGIAAQNVRHRHSRTKRHTPALAAQSAAGTGEAAKIQPAALSAASTVLT